MVVEVKYVSSTNLVAHKENCKLDIPLNCSVKELEKTLIRMCGVENFGTGISTKNWLGNGIWAKFWVGNGICNPPFRTLLTKIMVIGNHASTPFTPRPPLPPCNVDLNLENHCEEVYFVSTLFGGRGNFERPYGTFSRVNDQECSSQRVYKQRTRCLPFRLKNYYSTLSKSTFLCLCL